jgi:hypothetical protein
VELQQGLEPQQGVELQQDQELALALMLLSTWDQLYLVDHVLSD